MGLTAEKKRLIIRRVIFAVLLIFCAVIQNTPGLLPEPFGAHQLAVTVMVLVEPVLVEGLVREM